MLYGIAGAHRSGKTSVAKLAAEKLGFDFLDSSFDVAKKFGYNPVGRMTLGERVAMQTLVLEDHIEKVSAITKPTITDRTPLDYFGYTLAQFGMTSHTEASQVVLDAANELARRFLKETTARYDMVFICDLLPVYEVDETKATPSANPAFQLHIQALIHGAASLIHGDFNYAMVPVMPLEKRADFICEEIATRMTEIQELKQVAGMH